MIKELTQKQFEKIPYYVETFTRKSFETGKCDRNKVNNSINLCYEKAELKQPKEIIWFDNPKDMIENIIPNIIKNNVLHQVRYNVLKMVNNQVLYQILAQIKNQVLRQVLYEVRCEIFNQISNQVRRDKILNQILNLIVNQVSNDNILYGQHTSNVIGFYSFFENEFDLDINYSSLDGLKGMLESGWWIPYENICLVSERPNIYRFEKYPKLGSLYKPAIEWDNYEIWIDDVYNDILE